jgi:hypothetical protein
MRVKVIFTPKDLASTAPPASFLHFPTAPAVGDSLLINDDQGEPFGVTVVSRILHGHVADGNWGPITVLVK